MIITNEYQKLAARADPDSPLAKLGIIILAIRQLSRLTLKDLVAAECARRGITADCLPTVRQHGVADRDHSMSKPRRAMAVRDGLRRTLPHKGKR